MLPLNFFPLGAQIGPWRPFFLVVLVVQAIIRALHGGGVNFFSDSIVTPHEKSQNRNGSFLCMCRPAKNFFTSVAHTFFKNLFFSKLKKFPNLKLEDFDFSII